MGTLEGEVVLGSFDVADEDASLAEDWLNDALYVLLKGPVLFLHIMFVIIFYKWNLAKTIAEFNQSNCKDKLINSTLSSSRLGCWSSNFWGQRFQLPALPPWAPLLSWCLFHQGSTSCLTITILLAILGSIPSSIGQHPASSSLCSSRSLWEITRQYLGQSSPKSINTISHIS